ncbi:DNA helicase II [Spirochaetia bacterium]|nr:DNA helicase II [Spirochaetia bacterium]
MPFDFGHANEAQQQAIATTDGPLLIIAGPGTGKTFTLVQRAAYLIEEKGVKPENIMMATFTEKAAKELITRLSTVLLDKNPGLNINDMYIGTFHSICLRIIKDNLEFSNIKKNYQTLDAFDQAYMIYRDIYRFITIENFDTAVKDKGTWGMAKTICAYVNNLSEELVNYHSLLEDTDPAIIAMGRIMEKYNEVLEAHNAMDFSRLQTEAWHILTSHPEILTGLQEKIQYLMIDEYQDTNHIQEKLVFLIGGKTNNICVVGDDDQGLYRFRGATIRNIIEFPHRFPKELEIKQVKLVINYRSNSDIVSFYNKWMNDPTEFKWSIFRYLKQIVPHKGNIAGCPAVLRNSGDGKTTESWHKNVLSLINKLNSEGKISNLNQIAFLFSSVKSKQAVGLASYLEENDISVYSPRSDMFFKREEIMLVIGIYLLIFINYTSKLEQGSYEKMKDELRSYYLSCMALVKEKIISDKARNKRLLEWIKGRGLNLYNLTKPTDYAYSGLLYQLFEFEPFHSFLDVNIGMSGVKDLQAPRNLATLSQVITKFEFIYKIDLFHPDFHEKNTEYFFNTYLRLLFEEGIGEYEDDSEYAPSGCISFLTIHQSKGMEFPVVLVDSLYKNLGHDSPAHMKEIEKKYFSLPPFEPYEDIPYFDFWRLYYTAFSRAQNLLVLTSPGTGRDPNKHFREKFFSLPDWDFPDVDLGKLELQSVKPVTLKNSFSFTSHITVYENCGLQYKYFKELEFVPIRTAPTIYGQIVHETIEDIHRAAIRGEEHTITEENINRWFFTNYDTLSKYQHAYLAEPQKKSALESILRYARRQDDKWDTIKQAEVSVSLVKDEYILNGKIDLIKGKDSADGTPTVEIVDFKSEKKPDIQKEKTKIDRYKRQLQIYAHLVEQNLGMQVSKMYLYYTSTPEGSLPTISIEPKKSEINNTIKEFDKVVAKIQNADFSQKAKSTRVCENCDFRYYCRV